MTAEAARVIAAQKSEAKDHNLVDEAARETVSKGVHYEKRPVKGTDGKPVAGLFNAWITLDNPTQFNSYTTADLSIGMPNITKRSSTLAGAVALE